MVGHTTHHQTTDNSLTYMTLFEANEAGLAVARMRNAAGSIVSPTQTAVQAAMTAYRSAIDSGRDSFYLYLLFSVYIYFRFFIHIYLDHVHFGPLYLIYHLF